MLPIIYKVYAALLTLQSLGLTNGMYMHAAYVCQSCSYLLLPDIVDLVCDCVVPMCGSHRASV